MWEGCYSSEPFDLRLTVLRMIRCLGWVAALTLLGTLVFGGGYYVKNVLLGEGPRYEQTITCKIEYTDPPMQSGDYYINEMTWNTYVDSQAFWEMLTDPVHALPDQPPEVFLGCPREDCLSAAVASDIHVPSVTVSCPVRETTERLSGAVQEVLTDGFVKSLPEVASLRVIDVSDVERVMPDVRPLRAVVLSAVLSCFFAVTALLLREIGADSIWLPATLRRRYGLKPLGTVNSAELAQNTCYLFKNAYKIAVCAADDGVDPQKVTESMKDILQKSGDKPRSFIAVGNPLKCPEAADALRQADGTLLAVTAGLHAGKPLERVLEYFAVQDVNVTAALLWNADEGLIRWYYRTGGNRIKDGEDRV